MKVNGKLSITNNTKTTTTTTTTQKNNNKLQLNGWFTILFKFVIFILCHSVLCHNLFIKHKGLPCVYSHRHQGSQSTYIHTGTQANTQKTPRWADHTSFSMRNLNYFPNSDLFLCNLLLFLLVLNVLHHLKSP